jgi:hypothetical protein
MTEVSSPQLQIYHLHDVFVQLLQKMGSFLLSSSPYDIFHEPWRNDTLVFGQVGDISIRFMFQLSSVFVVQKPSINIPNRFTHTFGMFFAHVAAV